MQGGDPVSYRVGQRLPRLDVQGPFVGSLNVARPAIDAARGMDLDAGSKPLIASALAMRSASSGVEQLVMARIIRVSFPGRREELARSGGAPVPCFDLGKFALVKGSNGAG